MQYPEGQVVILVRVDQKFTTLTNAGLADSARGHMLAARSPYQW
jgi:hypothetical protein